jgi:hypothetical protein
MLKSSKRVSRTGHRRAQPARARSFIELAIQRLHANMSFELTAKELEAAEARGTKSVRRKKARL